MATTTSPQPSFSPRRKWSIAFSVTAATIAVFAILIGVNYLSSRYFFHRFYLSADTRVKLSPRTLSVLKSLTNKVEVTVFYDKEDDVYPEIVSLLREYQSHTHHLTWKTVDFYSNPGAAAELKVTHPYLGSLTNRNFIMFECEGRPDFVDGNLLKPYDYKLVQTASTNGSDPQLSIVRKQTVFNGEMLFTAKIFGVTQPKALKAYFLQGHGERALDKDDEGYLKFAEVFHRNHIVTETLDNLLGTNAVPLDCNLLVIAGPRAEFQEVELEKISQYLDQGGRLFALYDANSAVHNLGLESVLAKWNVRVGHGIVLDPDLSSDSEHTGSAFGVTNFAPHDIMRSLAGFQMEFILPRPIERIKAPSQAGADEAQVTELAFSSVNSRLKDMPARAPTAYPLMVAVEKAAAKGVLTQRGTTRMIIAGDSMFLDNYFIAAGYNDDFADSAINWLLERTTVLSGVGPRPITEYRLQLTEKEVNAVKGILLGAIPGGILLFGGLVWLRRRK
jgi:gliding motility-associatede transport system auxiliary component